MWGAVGSPRLFRAPNAPPPPQQGLWAAGLGLWGRECGCVVVSPSVYRHISTAYHGTGQKTSRTRNNMTIESEAQGP